MEAAIEAGGVSPERIIGYSVNVGTSEKAAPVSVTQSGNIISVDSLENGLWHVSVRVHYTAANGVKYWSAPVNADFTVDLPSAASPAVYAKAALKKMGVHPGTVAFLIIVMSVAVAGIGFGHRLAFYIRLTQFRARRFFILLREQRLAIFKIGGLLKI
jgi:hypothetical protein